MMEESKVNAEQFIVLQGWMITDLKLKGNELIIYACIYGFSQAENQVFSGSLQYLADWTNSTKQTVINGIKSLIEKGYLEKTDKIINGVKFCEYRAIKILGVVKNFDGGSQKILTGVVKNFDGGSQKFLPNNIDNNLIDNIENNKDIYIAVIDYLNSKTGQHFRSSTKSTRQHINARLAEGFTLDDFKCVIEKKCAEWLGDSKMEKYLRPETLFGTKFEGYLNAKQQSRGANGISVSSQPSVLDGVF